MALVLDDRIKETSTTILTADYVLLGAATGFQSFATVGNGNTTWYMATDGTDWEVGIGTYSTTGPTLARTTIISSSNADAAVSWGAGTRTIVCTMPSSKAFVGPASATDNAVVRFDGTGGRTVQNSGVTISDTDVLTAPALVDISGASAGQIKFPATQNASADANTLDDYEEGTFTPAFAATGATFSYASQTGNYTKIGNRVFFAIDISLNTSGNTLTANALTITGLPFTSNAANGGGIFPIRWNNSTTSYVGMWARVNDAATTMAIEALTAAGTSNTGVPSSDTALHATNGSTMRIKGFYHL